MSKILQFSLRHQNKKKGWTTRRVSLSDNFMDQTDRHGSNTGTLMGGTKQEKVKKVLIDGENTLTNVHISDIKYGRILSNG